MNRRARRRIEQIVRHFPENGLKMLLQDPENVREMLSALNFAQVDRLDFKQMKLKPTTFIPRDYRHVEADLVLTIPFRAGSSSRKAVTIYILIEHQSEPDRLMSFRVLDYVVQILKNQLRAAKKKAASIAAFRFQPVVPIVFYTGLHSWPAIIELGDLFEAAASFQDLLPKLKPLFLNISFLQPEALEHAGGLFAWVLRLLQERESDERRFHRIVHGLLDFGTSLPKLEIERWKEVLTYLSAFVYHYRESAEHERLTAEIEQAARSRGIQEEVQVVKKTMAEVLRREGRQEGELKNRREYLLTLLTSRFGNLDDQILNRIKVETNAGVLDDWFKRGLSARTLKQVGIS